MHGDSRAQPRRVRGTPLYSGFNLCEWNLEPALFLFPFEALHGLIPRCVQDDTTFVRREVDAGGINPGDSADP